MFNKLQDGFAKVFARLTGKTSITESDFDSIVHDIKVTLLGADVGLPVVKELIEKIKEKAVGEKVIKAIKPDQQIIKIVNDVLIDALSSARRRVDLKSKPTVFLLLGLQGAGKTTMAGKLAKLYHDKGKKVLLASLDIYRPAAQKQLELLAAQAGVDSLNIVENEKPVDIAKRAHKKANNSEYDLLILDSAGRLHVDDTMLQELRNVLEVVQVDEKVLVVDSLTGQDAVAVARSFKEEIGVDSIAVSRVDADNRGGVVLSMKLITGAPIMFMGTGEKITDFAEFHPKRSVSRLLGRGDIVTLVEKASKTVEKTDAKKLALKLKKGSFDMNDLMGQLHSIKKLGGIANIAAMLPGMGNMMGTKKIDEKMIDKQIAVIQSMTLAERSDPIKVLNGSRKRRIALGSGSTVQDVNRILKQYQQMLAIVKKFRNMDDSKKSNLSIEKLLSGSFFQ